MQRLTVEALLLIAETIGTTVELVVAVAAGQLELGRLSGRLMGWAVSR